MYANTLHPLTVPGTERSCNVWNTNGLRRRLSFALPKKRVLAYNSARLVPCRCRYSRIFPYMQDALGHTRRTEAMWPAAQSSSPAAHDWGCARPVSKDRTTIERRATTKPVPVHPKTSRKKVRHCLRRSLWQMLRRGAAGERRCRNCSSGNRLPHCVEQYLRQSGKRFVPGQRLFQQAHSHLFSLLNPLTPVTPP